MEPLLEVDRLTLRFRGLVAVKDVSLQVPRGQICAVIGPNGAGKTSLFNAITGIYEPNAGTVKFEGKDLRAPLTTAQWLRWATLGLAVGLALFLFVADVDRMWAQVVKPNFPSRQAGFQFESAFAAFKDALAARPMVELRTGRYTIVTLDGKTPFGSDRSRDDALARRERVLTMMELDGRLDTIVADPAGFALLGPDKKTVLDRAPARDVLENRVKAAAAANQAADTARGRRALAFLLGLLLGGGGGFAIWRQTRRTPSRIAARGLARTFQNIRLFSGMSALENVLVGMDRHLGEQKSFRRRLRAALPALGVASLSLGLAMALRLDAPGAATVLFLFVILAAAGYVIYIGRLGAFTRLDVALEATATDKARELLDFVGLGARADDQARNLAYGDQRRLEIARALATRPKLLLLDEPAAGMNPSESVALMGLIRRIRDQGTSILLIEHHMRLVMAISDQITVLEHGVKIAEGTPAEIRENHRVIEAYLGKDED